MQPFPDDFPDTNSVPPAPRFSEAVVGVPHSLEAEEAVVGSVLINPEVFWDLIDIITAEDFYIHRLRFIWEAYCTLFGTNTPVDILTVSERLDDMGRLDEIGGNAYLTSLLNQVPTSLHAEAYAKIMESCSIRRKLLVSANMMATLAYDEAMPIEDVEEKVDKLMEARPTSSKSTIVLYDRAADNLQEQVDSGKMQGVKSGLPKMDEVMGAYPYKGATFIYGGSSIGKSALALQSAEQVDFSGSSPLYISLESSPEKMVMRRVFSSLNIPMRKMRDASLTTQEKIDIGKGINAYKASHHRLAFDDRARTLSGIERSIRQHRPKFVVIDDLMHVRNEKVGRGSDTMALLDTVMRLKDMAVDHDLAMFIIHTMTSEESEKFWPSDGVKPTKNVAPSVNGIGWARDISFRVDIMIGLVPDFTAKRTDDLLKLCAWFLKDREGETYDLVELFFDKKRQWFFDNSSSTPTAVMQNLVAPASAPARPVSGSLPIPKDVKPIREQSEPETMSVPIEDVDPDEPPVDEIEYQ